MHEAIREYVERGAASMASTAESKRKAEAARLEVEQTEKAVYIQRGMEAAKALLPFGLHPFLVVDDREGYQGLRLRLDLPDCYPIRFFLANGPGAAIEWFKVPGQPYINKNAAWQALLNDYEWSVCNDISDERGDKLRSLDLAIANAYIRQNTAAALEQEVQAHNEALKERARAKLAELEAASAAELAEAERVLAKEARTTERIEALTGRAAVLQMLEDDQKQAAIAACLFRLAYVNESAF